MTKNTQNQITWSQIVKTIAAKTLRKRRLGLNRRLCRPAMLSHPRATPNLDGALSECLISRLARPNICFSCT